MSTTAIIILLVSGYILLGAIMAIKTLNWAKRNMPQTLDSERENISLLVVGSFLFAPISFLVACAKFVFVDEWK